MGQHLSAVIGIAAAATTLCIMGADNFMIPAMALILIGIACMRRRIEPAYTESATENGGEGCA